MGKTVCTGCTGCTGGGACSGTGAGDIINGDSFCDAFVEAGTNIFFDSGFFGVTGTHSFSENNITQQYHMGTSEIY